MGAFVGVSTKSGPGLSSSFEWVTFSKSCPQLQRVWKLKDNKEGLPEKPRTLRRFLMHVTASTENVEDRLVDRMISSNIRFDVISWIGIPCFLRFEFIKFIKFTIDFSPFRLVGSQNHGVGSWSTQVLLHVPCCRARESRSALQGSAAGQDDEEKDQRLVVCCMKRLCVCLVFSCCFLRLRFTYFVKSVRPCAIWASPIQNPAFRRPGLKCGFVAVPKINSHQLLSIRRVWSYRKLFLILYTHRKIHKCITERCFFLGK